MDSDKLRAYLRASDHLWEIHGDAFLIEETIKQQHGRREKEVWIIREAVIDMLGIPRVFRVRHGKNCHCDEGESEAFLLDIQNKSVEVHCSECGNVVSVEILELIGLEEV